MAAVLPASIGQVTIIPLTFRGGVLGLAVIYLGLGLVYALAQPAPTGEPDTKRSSPS